MKCIKRILALVSAAFCIAMMTALPVLPAEQIDLSRTGAITVTIKDLKTGQAVAGGRLKMFYIAGILAENGYHFDASGTDFAGYGLAVEEDGDLTAALAQDLADYAKAQGIAGKVLKVGEDGKAGAGDLKLGLYLFVQEQPAADYAALTPFLVSVPQRDAEGSYIYSVDATPKTGTEKKTTPPPPPPEIPRTGQLWWPVWTAAGLGAVLFAAGYLRRRG